MPSEDDTQAEITKLVKLWLPAKGMRKGELARLLGITPDNLSHTMTVMPSAQRTRRRWTAHDVRMLESEFNVPAGVWWGNYVEEREALVLELELELLDRLAGS